MTKASNAFTVLQAIAVVVSLAIIFWSLGLYSLNFAKAANLTTISDTLSTSEPLVASDHTLVFTTPTGVGAGETIVITFPDEATDFDLSTIGAEDIDLASTSDYSVQNGAAAGETWGVSTSTFGITLTSGTAVLSANATVTIEIGANATFGGGSQTQIVNPNTGSYEINVSAGASDSGATRVAIVNTVTVSASVDTSFTFTVAGVAGGQSVNGTTTGGTTTATVINFGELDSNVASTAAQDLTVSTNAANGFVVTVIADGQLDSASTGADIDGFRNGNFETTAVPWEGPTPSIGDEDTYGHWGITSDDPTTGTGLIDRFDVGGDGQDYLSASTSPVEVFRHDSVADGTTTGQGTTRVGYTVEISDLQEAATDYQAVLTYIATPVF